MNIIILLVTGLAAGILGAILGLGGGVIMLPALNIFFAYDAVMAVGTTLVAIVFTSLSASQGHYRAGHVLFREALFMGAGGIAGVLIGSYVFAAYLSTNTDILQGILGILFLFMTVRMGQQSYSLWKNPQPEQAKEWKQTAPWWGFFLLGLVTGTLTGILGVGGGFIMVPALMFFFGVVPHLAVGTTMTAMFPITLVGAIIKWSQGFVCLIPGLLLGLGTAIGAQFGVLVSRHLSVLLMNILFTLVFFLVALDYLQVWF
ncbi:MAG TPA: sulfite exporter TauE/SafE family protein [Syntrophomonadaceae bacterium]|nr:sulfite exporter TauE/SafE family protein [Syntrophomonadaceae bacterium]